MGKTVLLLIAGGTEEIEAVVPIDLLRRANIHVKVAGENEIVTCSRFVKILPDMLIDHLNSEMEFSAIILPGGKSGTNNLLDNEKVIKLLKKHNQRGGWIAAICAAPIILLIHKIINENTKITAHPSVRNMFDENQFIDEKVVVSENFITSSGAGTSFEFSLKIIELLQGKEIAERVANEIVFSPCF